MATKQTSLVAMKFETELASKVVPEWKFYYLDYKHLKQLIEERTTAGSFYEEQDEAQFVDVLEQEIQKVFDFRDMKSGELTRHVQYCEKEAADLSMENQEAFGKLKAEIDRITSELSNLATFTRINYEGFLKVLKRHDKKTEYMLKPMFMLRLKSKPLYIENLDNLVYRLSKLYSKLRPGEQVREEATSKDAGVFIRKTTKYWVHPDNVAEVKCTILKYLPVLVFPNERRKVDPAVSSVYFDSADLDLYAGRLHKFENAEAIRFRWYGSDYPKEVFAEKKVHKEDWTGEISFKSRFSLKEKHVQGYIDGTLTPEHLRSKMLKSKSKTLEEIDVAAALASEIRSTIVQKALKPCVRTCYNRTAFQLPADARVRISLDTDLVMINETTAPDGAWCRTDIPRSYPYAGVDEKDIARFPYAILEVKLQTQSGQEIPIWVERLVKGNLVEAVPKFSKYLHGCAALFPERVQEIPYWFPQMNVDIRKYDVETTEYMASEKPAAAGQSSQQLIESLSSSTTLSSTEDEKSPLIPPTAPLTHRPQHESAAEKRIAVPIRVEPKVFFANERTFLSWIHFSSFLGGIATALIGLGKRNARITGYIFALMSICYTAYALYLYEWRAKRIRMRDPGPYDDRAGPAAVALAFLAAMVVNVTVSLAGSGTAE